MSGIGLVGGRLSNAERDRIRVYIRDPEQMASFHVVPAETGLGRTIWVSQNEAYPAVLVAPEPGRRVHPPDDALIVGFEETTPFADVNERLNHNRDLLAVLAAQELDVADFYERMESRRLPQDDFEMVSAWIRANRVLIMDYWDNKVDTNEFRLRIAQPPADR